MTVQRARMKVSEMEAAFSLALEESAPVLAQLAHLLDHGANGDLEPEKIAGLCQAGADAMHSLESMARTWHAALVVMREVECACRPIAPRPYPFAPIQALMDLHKISDSELGIWTGATNIRAARRKVQRWKVAGMTEAQADAAACALHCHPAEVWRDYWWVLAPMAQNEDEDSSDSEGASDEQGDRPVTHTEHVPQRERPS